MPTSRFEIPGNNTHIPRLSPKGSMKKKQQNFFLTLAEIAVVFAVFYLFGAWPIPDSNEPYYVGKAIHYWNPGWVRGDTFLQSKDAHWTFYVVFGWLTFFFSPEGMAQTGRLVTWALLALGWQRLSFALIPTRWMSIPGALALAYYVDSFHFAGEWILGGVEGKSFAFPFVLFGLEAMVRGRWHRTWIFLGIASAFHVLVGGWTVLVAGFVWLVSTMRFPQRSTSSRPLTALLPWGLFLGGLISLLGLAPVLLLDYGTPKDVVREAHQIYVFKRIYHHLVPYMLPWTFLARFGLLSLTWALFCRFDSTLNRRRSRFNLFVWGTLILSLVGLAVAYGLRDNRELSAELLRFYWFRLSDVAVPMGVALGGLRALLQLLKTRRPSGSPQPFRQGTVFTALTLLGTAFALYLAVDYLLFHRRLYMTTRPEQGIPWLMTLILCGLLAGAGMKRSARIKSASKIGMILVYAALLLYAPFDSLKVLGDLRTAKQYSRSESGHPIVAYYWRDICRWVRDPANTPKEAKFLVPRDGSTFKWYANRSDVGNWKDIPQDAEGIVAWYKTMQDLFFYRDEQGSFREDRSLTILLWWKTPEELEELRVKYGFEYALCNKFPALPKHKAWKVVYENEQFRLYRFHGNETE